MTSIGKNLRELTLIANEALRSQPGCETANIPALSRLTHVTGKRNWEIPEVAIGDSLISDVDRAVITVHHQVGRQFHLLGE